MLQILTTPEFVPGSIIVPFIAFGMVLFSYHYICQYVINLIKRTELIAGLLGTSAAINVILNIILIPRLGILGAAVATFIAYGVLGMLVLMLSRKYLKFDLSPLFILKSAFSSAIMTFCIWLINPESITLVITSVILGVIIYFGVLVLIKGLSKEEIGFFVNFLRNNLKKIRIIK